MSDHGAPAAAPAPAATAGPAKSNALKGPLAAGVVLIGIGVGLGWYVSSLVKVVKTEAVEEAKKEEEPEHKKDDHHGIEHLSEIKMPDLMSNVRNQAGRRYIKVSCAFWLGHEEAGKFGFVSAGGGHGGGGGDAGAEVKRIIQMTLEEHLRSYDIDELTGPNISLQLKKGFKDRIEKVFHELHPDLKPEQEIVHRVVLTNILVQ